MSTETTDWDALRLLRLHGQRPSLPVIITTKPYLPQRLEGIGCMVILHKAGERMPVKLLDGLHVIFFFERCELGGHVTQLAKEKRVTFASSQTWCCCDGRLSTLPLSCESMADMIEWAEGKGAYAT
jgi:hypothetical protein